MKSVEIMLNFLRKKTVKRNEGRSDDPLLMTSSEDTARRSEKSRSVAFEGDFTNGGPHRLHSSMHSTCSLDDVRSAPSQRAAYVKNHRKTSLASGLDDCCSEFQNGIIRPLNEQPTKLYHSPKASQRLSNSHRSSGHSRSLSAIADPALRSADRKHQRSSVQVTPPRLYRKNPQQQQQQQQQQKVLPFHTSSSSSAAAEMSFSGSQGSMQWSFGRYGVVDDASSPVPPPRKKRSSRAGRDVDGDKSSQTSSSTEATSDGRRPCDAFCFDSEFAADSSSNIESPEFRCNLPNDFSNLGLDILNIPSAVLIQSNEKSNFDLLQEIDRKKKKQKKRDDAYLCNLASPTTKDRAAFIKSRDVLRIEEPSSCRTFDSDSFILNNECSTSSVCDSSAQSVFHNETAELSRTPKHLTALIVKSIFSKNQKQEFSERFNLIYGGGGGGGGEEEEDDASSAKGGQTFDFPPQSASFAASQCRSSPGATDVLESFRNASESCSVDENSACVGPSVALNSDRNSQSVYREDLSTNGVRVLQPDVLIGTQQSHASSFGCCGSSSADDSKQSLLQGNPVHNRVHSTMKPFTCDLSVGHQLHGFPSQTLVAINEKWTSQDVIERILTLERISDDWFLYGLFICSHDPSHGNNGVLELDMDDFLARYLDEDDRQTGSVWFELRRTEGLKIRVSCDASFEKPKTIAFEISRRILCRFVVDAAVAKFELRSPTKFCLIELDRSRKELVMRRINESEVLSRLNSGHFLLCEKEFLFESRRKVDQLPLTSPLMSSFSSRLSYLPTRNAFTHHEVDALKSQVKQLEAKLVDNERHFRQKLTRHQSQMGRYRSIALCTAPNSRLLLLEEECRRLTEEMQDHERQIKTQELEDICRISSDSKKERERLLSMKNACMKLNNERQEVYDCLLQETAKVERQEQSNGRCLRSSFELFSICRHSQGGRLYAVEIDRSELLLDGIELVSCSEGGGHCLRVRRSSSSSSSCHHLTEGDRILEINGHRALHLTDVELVALLEKTTENLRVVVLRDEARNNNNNSNNNNVHQL